MLMRSMTMRKGSCGSSSMKVTSLIFSSAMSLLVPGMPRTPESFGKVTLDNTVRSVSSFFLSVQVVLD